MLYSKSTNGFYIKEIHGENIPSDSIEIDDDLYQELIDGQSNGKIISTDKKGYPILCDAIISDDFLLIKCKKEAKKLLELTDYSQTIDVYESIENKDDFIKFRKIVRNLFINPVKDAKFPEIPTPVWIKTT
jgi:hypothetical protein